MKRLNTLKKVFFIGFCLAVLGFSTLANAALIDNGGGLIYDTDLNITWYDAPLVLRNWQDSMDWAATLTVGNTGAGTWRLPATVDGTYVWGFDGTTTAGYNITTSEMGHLQFTELGNKAYFDTSGNTQADFGLLNKGPFTNLVGDGMHSYYSGTGYGDNPAVAWCFSFFGGEQFVTFKVPTDYGVGNLYALAVHEGNVGAPVPIPSAILLFAPGLAGIALLRRRLKK